MKDKILELANKFHNETREYRRYIHMYPELSFNEFQTTEFIVDTIKNFEGVEIFTNFAETGLVAKIEGKNPDKKSVALRADIDALPIQEQNEKIPFKSKNDGIMHACGHDVHSASLITACRILSLIKNEFEGTIWCIFQPAEEKLPGGAKLMLDNGLFEFIKPDFVIGQHVMPDIPAGKIGIKAGNFMASTDEIYLKITGKGGHAALPFKLVDPVVIQAQVISALQTIVSRTIPAHIPSVLSFGKIEAPGATNIIPEEVKIEGTFRTMNEDWRKEALSKIDTITRGISEAFGGKAEVKIINGYPVLYNDPELTKIFKEKAIDILGKENVLDIEIRMTAEDFAYYSHKAPSIFYRLGTGNPQKPETLNPLHSANFNVDEGVLAYSPALLVYGAININLKK
jgi:amidohydrolase